MMKRRVKSYILFSSILLSSVQCSVEDEYNNKPIDNYNALWEILNERYSYFDIKLPKDTTWRDVYNKYRSEVKDKMSTDELFLVLNKMMRELKDGHVNLITSFDYGRYWNWNTDYPSHFNAKVLEKYLGDEYRIAGGLLYTQIKYNNHTSDSIGLIRYSSFSSPVSISNISAVLSRLSKCKALIFDIRDNSGGNITTSDLLASHFMEQDRVVGYTRHKTGKGHNDFSELVPLNVEATKAGVRWLRPVVLLTNRGVYSAANDFTLKMKGLPYVTIMGDQTGGGGGLPMTSELPNGWVVRYSSTQTFDTHGQHIEDGIAPDYRIVFDEKQAEKHIDTMIEDAIIYINSRYQEAKRTKKWIK